jgi:hypothetical protein
VWTGTTGSVGNWSSYGEPAHSGVNSAYLRGYGSTHTEAINASVSIRAGCSATLSFYLHIDTSETTTTTATTATTAYDKLTVKAGSTTLATYSDLNVSSGYSLKSFTVSSLAGRTVTISFSGTEDSSLQTSFVIDDTALTTLRGPTMTVRRGWSGGRGVRREACVEEGPGSEGQGGGQHPPGATRGTVPQRTDRRRRSSSSRPRR